MNQLPVIKADDITVISDSISKAYDENIKSHNRCIDACNTLLDDINRQGMNTELDAAAAQFIDRARRTVKVMADKRTPVTKVFDEIRRQFTILENEIDPSKVGTVTYRLQQARNDYARRLHEAEQQRIFAEQQRKRIELAKARLNADIKDFLCAEFDKYIETAIRLIEHLESSSTIDNFQQNLDALSAISPQLDQRWGERLHFTVQPFHAPLAETDARQMSQSIYAELLPRFSAQYAEEVGATLDAVLRRMPSRLAEMNRIKAANAEEAARLKSEMEAKMNAEKERAEQERRKREEKALAEAALTRQQQINSIFDVTAATQPTTPKAKVEKKIILLAPEGILPVLSMWFSEAGCSMPVDELAKMFSRQIRFCEQLANKKDVTIKDAAVSYVDSVKAK